MNKIFSFLKWNQSWCCFLSPKLDKFFKPIKTKFFHHHHKTKMSEKKENKKKIEAKTILNTEKPILNSLPKRKLLSTITHGEISLREFTNINCDGSTIIEGIPQ